MTLDPTQPIGYIVSGSLQGGLEARLSIPAVHLQEGAFVVAKVPPGEHEPGWQFYGLVTDLRLAASDERFADEQVAQRFGGALAALLYGQTLYTTLLFVPHLMLEVPPEDPEAAAAWWAAIESGQRARPRPMPVKTIPPHHTRVYLATQGDVDEIFGKADAEGRFFEVGTTREQGYAVRLDLERFIRRPSGVFGATGAGKSFLVRLLLAGLIHYGRAAVLIYDMHNEYGFDSEDPEKKTRVIGLKTKFPARVRVVALGRGALIHGNKPPDYHLEIAMHDIEPADILLLRQTLDLTDTAALVLDMARKQWRRHWFQRFTALEPGKTEVIVDDKGRERRVPTPDSVEGWAREHNIHEQSALALHRRLRQLRDRDYVVETPADDTLDAIIQDMEHGRAVVLSFGEYETELDYLFVSNLLTRLIREHWVRRTNAYRSGQADEPRPLVVVVEEAHKLLSPEVAGQTTFNILAREMRKYYVTLLIVDQRPSQIDDEVMSQLGTRIAGWLGDEHDIRAVLAGLSGRETLRGLLSRLQLGEEVLIAGFGVPMPIVVRTRRYDDAFWRALLGDAGTAARSEDDLLADLGY